MHFIFLKIAHFFPSKLQKNKQRIRQGSSTTVKVPSRLTFGRTAFISQKCLALAAPACSVRLHCNKEAFQVDLDTRPPASPQEPAQRNPPPLQIPIEAEVRPPGRISPATLESIPLQKKTKKLCLLKSLLTDKYKSLRRVPLLSCKNTPRSTPKKSA